VSASPDEYSEAPEVFRAPHGGQLATGRPLTKAAMMVLLQNFPAAIGFDELCGLAQARLGARHATAGDDRNVRAAGVVLLALSTQLVWGPILFQFFTPELLRADAALVGEILKPLRPDIIWRGTTFVAPDGHAVTLIGGCSSFNNVSTAVLACVAITMLRRTEWFRRDVRPRRLPAS
jgi:hypothetical protein